MCSTISFLLLLLVIIATASLQTAGIHLRRKYVADGPFLTSRQSRPKVSSPFVPIPGKLHLGPRFSSRNSNNKPAVPQRLMKPSINSRAEIPNPYGIKPVNNVRAVPPGQRISKPITSGGQSGRPRPITFSNSKSSNQENLISSLTGTTRKPGVKMKPVHEEGSLMKIPVYINSFPEFNPQESSKLKDSRTVNYYEPLGDYARFK